MLTSADGPECQNEQLAAQLFCDSRFFIKEVTDLANKRNIVAGEDIFAINGMKLVSKGSQLSSDFHDRLVVHKLLKPLEQSLSIDNPLDAKTIINLVIEEARHVPALAPLYDSPEFLERLLGLLGDLRIPSPLRLRLSVMQESLPALFQHSLTTTVLAMAVGIRGDLSREELRALTLASIFHDIGELFIAPDILSQEHKLSAEERRQIYVHPNIGYLMLNEFHDLPIGTATAVLQHHEQLNGCGYPDRLPADKIGRVSRYLAVAEVVASLIGKQDADKRIRVKMRMNRSKFDETAIAIIYTLFDTASHSPARALDEVSLKTRLPLIASLFKSWDALFKTFSPQEVSSIQTLISRINDLRMLVTEPGFDLSDIDEIMMLADQGDSEICAELSILLEELEWQIRDFSRETERFLFGWKPQVTPRLKDRLDTWFMQVHQFANA
jgi:HD-GYP domain-containing protein (c-di-GMP phosphodiesterase class II)